MFKLNILISVICLLLMILMSSHLYASNDLEKWNSEKGRVARSAMKDKLSTTSYRELPNHVDSSYRSTANGGKVLKQLETNAQVKGSRVGATIEALKDVDKMGAAKKFAKELGKGGVRFTVGAVLIEAAMDEMLDGIGWVIDEGGKVNRTIVYDINSEDYNKYNSKYMYKGSHSQYKTYSYSVMNGCTSYLSFLNNLSGGQDVYVSHNGATCTFKSKSGSTWTNTLLSYTNPHYNPSGMPTQTEVLEPEMVEKIRDYFENPQSPKSKDLLIEQAEKPRGKASIMWSDDPSSEQTIYSDNKNTAEKVLNSDDPVGDGLTKSTPKINDGTTVESETTTNTETNTNVNEHTVTNPDGSTTTTGTNVSNTTNVTNNNFDLPAFCDYASKLCEWLDWTKEEPELEDERKLEIEEQEITDYKYEDHVKWGSSCPFQEEIKELNMGVGVIKVKYNLDFFCDFGRKAKSTIVALGHLGALIFLMIGIRSGASG